MRPMNKKGEKKSPLLGVLITLMVIAIIGLGLWIAKTQGAFSSGGNDSPVVSQNNRPDTGLTALSFDVVNTLNTTGSEGFDVTAYVFQKQGSSWVKKATLTDTTAPSATNIDWGMQYKICAVASNSDGGDNSFFKEIRNGDAKVVDGCVEFTASGPTATITAGGEQHDVLTFRVYDKVDGRYAFDTGDAEAVTFEADGATFTDGDNATAFAVGSGGYVDFNIELKGADEDEDFADAYVLILVEAPIAEYKEPSVTFAGKELTDVSDVEGALTAQEKKQFDSYEYIYKVTGDIRNTPKTVTFYQEAAGGANPSTDLQIDFASAGNYLSTDGVSVKTGAADDTSSNAVVYAVQDVTIDIS